ncbi:MAG: phosphopantothenoylcysteine decarboxylase [Actinomycetota bacterium]|nr:phosphopantothenoylcysteine decarboxylase [Actinomycetota bacterium]
MEVESSMQMRDKVLEFYSKADITIMAAAVSDIIPGQRFDYKLKKKDDILSQLSFKLNQNILQLLAREKKPGQVLIGFAAETELTEQNVLEKFKGGNIDMIVANDISKQGRGIGSDYNQVILVSPDGSRTLVGKAKKNIIARKIWANIIENYL